MTEYVRLEQQALNAKFLQVDARLDALESGPPGPVPPEPGLPPDYKAIWVQVTANPTTARQRVVSASQIGATYVNVFTGTGYGGTVYRNHQGIPELTETLSHTIDEATSLGLKVNACIPVKYMWRHDRPEWNLDYTTNLDTSGWLDMRVEAARNYVAALITDLCQGYPELYSIILDYCRWDRFHGSFGMDNHAYITETVKLCYETATSLGHSFTLSPVSIWAKEGEEISEYDARRYGQYWGDEWVGYYTYLTQMCYTNVLRWSQDWGDHPLMCPIISPCNKGLLSDPRTLDEWQMEMEIAELPFAVFDRRILDTYPDHAQRLVDYWA